MSIPRVFISSTSGALNQYRDAAIDVCRRLSLMPVHMETFVAERPPPVDVCRREVEESDVFVLLVAHRYGARPPGETRSYTELEYEWALARPEMPLLPFVVDEDFPWPPPEIDRDPTDSEALERFLSRVRTHHVRKFGDLHAFREELFVSLKDIASGAEPSDDEPGDRLLPAPPAFVAVPPYAGGSPFTGRAADLAELDSWACSEDPVLVLEAVGGTGKSALTWEWVDTRAPDVVPDLAGRFWWSFYEGSASIRRFLIELLAYMQERPLGEVERLARTDLAEEVFRELRARTYVLILDGFERLLAAYHQFDPTKLREEEVEPARRALIEPDADLVVRELANARPSKVLISSRLLPEPLERYGRLLPGVRHRRLPGLTDEDTATLLARLGVRGDRDAFCSFFRRLGNHPLLIGIVAGLVRSYRQRPGDFDRWLEDPLAGGGLRLSDLDLTQRRHHILETALTGLPADHARVLGWLSVFTGAVPWATLESINPLRPEGPTKWLSPGATRAASRLATALGDLEERGLLWWDREANTYDLHPIVRAYGFEQLQDRERVTANDRVRAHFEALPPEDVEAASSVDDLARTITIFRSLVGGGRFDEATRLWETRLYNPLFLRMGAHGTVIELLAPLREAPTMRATGDLASAYQYLEQFEEAVALDARLLADHLKTRNTFGVAILLSRLSTAFMASGTLLRAARAVELLEQLNAIEAQDPGALAFRRAELALREGDLPAARRSFDEAEHFGFKSIFPSLAGDLALYRLICDSREDTLEERELDVLEPELTYWVQRINLSELRRDLLMQKADYEGALEAQNEYNRLARNGGKPVDTGYTAFLLTQIDRHEEAAAAVEDALSTLPQRHPSTRPHLPLAGAFLALGRVDEAREQALAAYRQAWADGPPHAWHWTLRNTRRVLDQLGLDEPQLATIDPATVTIPHENDIRAFIAELRSQRER